MGNTKVCACGLEYISQNIRDFSISNDFRFSFDDALQAHMTFTWQYIIFISSLACSQAPQIFRNPPKSIRQHPNMKPETWRPDYTNLEGARGRICYIKPSKNLANFYPNNVKIG